MVTLLYLGSVDNELIKMKTMRRMWGSNLKRTFPRGVALFCTKSQWSNFVVALFHSIQVRWLGLDEPSESYEETKDHARVKLHDLSEGSPIES